MKIFEFQFNPKASDNRFFRAFSFEESPEKGSIYIIGELANALPSNASLLDRIAEVIRQEYDAPEKQNQAASQRLKSALKKANDFLGEEVKAGNTDWIGNLHILVLLFVPAGQGYAFYFTKAGRVSLWMARSGSLVDAGKSIEAAKQEDGSPKVFGSVGSGKVIPGDRIIGLTQEAFEFFAKENFLQTIAQLSEEKQFKNIFKSKHKELSQIAGILFFLLADAFLPKAEEKQSVSARSLPRLKLPLPTFALPTLPKNIAAPFGKLQKPTFLLPARVASETKKRVSLFALLALLLLIGFAIFGTHGGRSEESERRRVVETFEEITDEVRAQYRILDAQQLDVASTLAESPVLESADAMLQLGSRFYFFSSSAPNVLVFDGETNTAETFNAGGNLRAGVGARNTAFFFAEPNAIVSVDSELRVLHYALEGIPAAAQITSLSQFGENLYLIDARNGEIFKTPIPSGTQSSLERWVDPLSPRKPLNALAMGIDGNIWVLTEKNEIQRYFLGVWQETLGVDIVPAFQAITRLKTSAQLPYVYVLEPAQKRLVILSKTGAVLRQYRSPELARARDFTVSPDGQTLYVFDGQKLYRISPVEL